MLVYKGGETLARVGVMGESPVMKDAPILGKCFSDGRDGREQYLAALQVSSFLLGRCRLSRTRFEEDRRRVLVLVVWVQRRRAIADFAYRFGCFEHRQVCRPKCFSFRYRWCFSFFT